MDDINLWNQILKGRGLCLKKGLPSYEQETLDRLKGTDVNLDDGEHIQAEENCKRTNCGFGVTYFVIVSKGKIVDWRVDEVGKCSWESGTGLSRRGSERR